MNHPQAAVLLAGITLILSMGCDTVSRGGREFVMRPDGLFYHAQTGQLYSGSGDRTYRGSRFRYNIVKGQREGIFAEWYPGGQKKLEYNYRGNQKQGRARSWFENGQVRTDMMFENDRVIRGVTYQPDGAEASRLENGTGTLTAYFNNGKPSWEKTYQDGVRTRQRVWLADGTLKAED